MSEHLWTFIAGMIGGTWLGYILGATIESDL